MATAEMAELRGEVFGLRLLLVSALGTIARNADDLEAHLAEIQAQAIGAILRADPASVSLEDLPIFQSAAASVVRDAVEAIKAAHTEMEPTLGGAGESPAPPASQPSS